MMYAHNNLCMITSKGMHIQGLEGFPPKAATT